MLNREQQRLLGELGAGMATDALLDHLRGRGILEGGCSATQPDCWINFNRKAVWLEDHSEFSAALNAADGADPADPDTQAWRQVRTQVVVKVTWAQAAAYGATLPPELRTELDSLRRERRDENSRWSEFTDARGGWPWRQRFATEEEHRAAEAEWNAAYSKHLLAWRDIQDQQQAAVARALPLILDDEPEDLLDLLDQQDLAPAATSADPAAMQAGALRGQPAASPATGSDGVLFTQPESAPGIGR